MISVTLRGIPAPAARRTPFAMGVVALVLAFVLAMGAALAQEDAPAHQTTIDGWRATLADTQDALARADLTVADLDDERDKVLAVLTGARAFTAEIAPRVADLDAQLKAIAPAPEGATLPAEVAEGPG